MTNDFFRNIPRYNDDSDFTTNAESYYKDLARKQKLIKLLAEKIWKYENTLKESLESIEQRLTDYIAENDQVLKDMLQKWDERIANLDKEVSHIFVEWLNDGTLEQIINHDVLGNKADKTYVDENFDKRSYSLTKKSEENDYTMAFKRELEKLDSINGGSIIIPQNEVIEFSEVIIDKPNVRLIGGTLDGTIFIKANNFKCEGVTFKNSNPVIVKKGRVIRFEGCTFENSDKSIHVYPDNDAKFHGIAMLSVTMCHFEDVNYGLYIHKPTDSINKYLSNDFIFSNNIINKAFITHIYADEIDGIIISNNIFFFPNYVEKSFIKKHNIEIKNGTWVKIENNNLFESGFESILFNDVTNASVQYNNIAWGGQRKPSSAIKMVYSELTFAHLIISNNNINKISKHGIEVINGSAVQIKSNMTNLLNKSDLSYYGDVDLSTIDHFGVFVDSNEKVSLLTIESNPTFNGIEYNNKFFLNNMIKNFTQRVVTDDELDGVFYDTFKIEHSTPTEINDIKKNGNLNGKEITIFTNNDNTLIKSNSLIKLNGSKDFKMKKGDTLSLKLLENVWYETGRKGLLTDKIKDLTTTSTIIDVSDGSSQINIVQPTPVTITEIIGGSIGQEITLWGYNSNTTIKHTSKCLLKNDVDVVLSNRSVLKMRFYSGVWREVSRNF